MIEDVYMLVDSISTRMWPISSYNKKHVDIPFLGSNNWSVQIEIKHIRDVCKENTVVSNMRFITQMMLIYCKS